MAETLTAAAVLPDLCSRFPSARIARGSDGRIRGALEGEDLHEALVCLCSGEPYALADLTALDLSAMDGLTALDGRTGADAARMRISYQLRPLEGSGRCVQLSADFDPAETTLASVTDLWPGADWLEREVAEMFGIRFSDRAPTRPLVTPEGCVQPLRKCFPLRGAADRDVDAAVADTTLPDTTAVVAAMPTLRMRLDVVAGRVARAAPIPGFAHSGFEKLAESLTYMQSVVLCERLNEQAPHAGSLPLVLAVEAILAVEVPPRGNHQRVVIAELSRLAGHLGWLSMQAEVAGAEVVWRQAMQQRAAVLETMDRLKGVGTGTGLLAIGGQAADFPPDFSDRGLALSRSVRAAVPQLRKQLLGNRLWRDLVDGVAPLSANEAAQWGLSGPTLRACGTNRDLRKLEPYLVYGELDFDVPVGSHGDALDRCTVRLDEMVESTGLIEQALRLMPSGPWRTEDVRIFPAATSEQVRERVETMIRHMQLWTEGHGLRLPAGAELYLATESPNGELGVFLCADGTDRPYRLHLRSPSLMNFQIAGGLVADLPMAQARQVVCSLNVVPSEMDR